LKGRDNRAAKQHDTIIDIKEVKTDAVVRLKSELHSVGLFVIGKLCISLLGNFLKDASKSLVASTQRHWNHTQAWVNLKVDFEVSNQISEGVLKGHLLKLHFGDNGVQRRLLSIGNCTSQHKRNN
jgi:hypothetical protein